MLKFAAVLLSLSCTGVTMVRAAETDIAGTWLAEDIRGGGVIDNAQSKITFDADGKVSGSGGCNRFRGSATMGGDQLKIGPLGSTRMSCTSALMDQETKFFLALEAARSFVFDGAFLRLRDESGSEIMRLTRLQ